MHSLSNAVKTIRILAPVAAGSSNITTASLVDTAGFESCRFIVSFGAIVSGAATSIKVQGGADSGGSDLADLADTGITVVDTADNTLVIAEVVRPRERYLKLQILRATQNSTVDLAIAELCGPKDFPVAQDATVSTVEIHNSPLEGTA